MLTTHSFPFSFQQISNITPFTYRDGGTFLEQLYDLRDYVTGVVTPAFDAEMLDLLTQFQLGIANIEAAVEEDSAARQAAYDAFVVSTNALVATINNRVGPESMRRVTLASAYTLTPDPVWPNAHPVRFQFTQDGTGGRTVTAGTGLTGTLTVNPAPGAVTDMVLIPNGAGGWVAHTVDGDVAALLTAGTASLTAFDGRYTRSTDAAATYLAKTDAGITYQTQTAAATALAGKVGKGEQAVNVKDYGATGDGATDDTDAINTAIVAGAGRTVRIPKGTYMINAIKNVAQGNQPTGIMVNAAGTTLEFDQGAVFQAKTNTSTGYAVIQVTAPDCVISGGTVNGDMINHTATGGEFGHCIELAGGADRAVVRGTRVAYAWGDGILVWNRPLDVLIEGVTADSNRRQGISIIDAIRPRVIGCTLINTGQVKFTAPGAGIDIEPDPGTTRDVIDAVVADCIFANNKGSGFLIVSQGRTASATVTGCLATGNGDTGYLTTSGGVAGSPSVSYSGCDSRGNTGSGFAATDSVNSVRYKGCTANSNTIHGFLDSKADSTRITGCTAGKNGAAGYYVDSLSTNAAVTACSATGNCTTQPSMGNYDIYGPGTILTGSYSHAGAGPAYPAFAYTVRAGATTVQVIGCAAMGAYNTRAWADSASSYVNPIPGDTSNAARAEFTPPRVFTATGPMSATDSLVVGNITAAGGLTSLPDPTTIKGGTQFTVKNINATSLGVISQGTSKTIDGVAQINLAQWAKITVTTDGAQWLTL